MTEFKVGDRVRRVGMSGLVGYVASVGGMAQSLPYHVRWDTFDSNYAAHELEAMPKPAPAPTPEPAPAVALPVYVVEAFSDLTDADKWLNDRAAEGYELDRMTTIWVPDDEHQLGGFELHTFAMRLRSAR